MGEANEFVGLSKKDAQNLCDVRNFIFRLIRVDERNMLSYPEDTRIDRVCVELEKGRVVKAILQ